LARSIKDISKENGQYAAKKGFGSVETSEILKDNVFCLICGTSDSQFYSTNNPKYKIWGKIPWCLECLTKKFEEYLKIYKNENRALVELCYFVDIPYNQAIYDRAVEKSNETSLPLMRAYLALYSNLLHKLTESTSFGGSEQLAVMQGEKFGEPKKIEDPIWGNEYTQEEIDWLNNYYDGLKKDYDIITTNHEDYARKISKISLELDRTMNDVAKGAGDTQKYNSLSNIFDKMCKSANFVESQRDKKNLPGNFSSIFDMVEKGNWVPEYEPKDKDTYDLLLEQFANISKSL